MTHKTKIDKQDISRWAYNKLYGVPMSFKYEGHYKNVPIFSRDDVPQNTLYFINDEVLNKKES